MKCDWKEIELSEVADLTVGFVGTMASHYTDNGVLFLRSTNIEPFNIKMDDVKYISHEFNETIKKSQLNPDDVVIVRTGKPGACTVIPQKTEPWNCSDLVIIHPNKEKINPHFLASYINLASGVINAHLVGAVQQHFNVGAAKKMKIPLPSIDVQNRIASIIQSLNDKIELNNKINENLQQQAAMLFESWFIAYKPWGGIQPTEWEKAPLGSFVEIKRGGSPRPIQDYLSDSGFRWLKISDVTSLNSPFVLEIKEHIKEEGLKKTVLLKAGDLVLSNSATPGIPKILDVDSCIHDGWLYFPKSELSKYYLYLFFKHIRKELVALGNGSVFTNLKTDILKAYPVVKADVVTLKKFDSLVAPLFEAMLNVDRENLKLKSIRDVLLPKLMNGEMEIDR